MGRKAPSIRVRSTSQQSLVSVLEVSVCAGSRPPSARSGWVGLHLDGIETGTGAEPDLHLGTNTQEFWSTNDASSTGHAVQSSNDTRAAPLDGIAEEDSIYEAQPFYPFDHNQPRPFLSFARFDDDPELLESIQALDVPILQDAVWCPNSDGWLGGGFSYVEKAKWNEQEVAVKFLRSSQTATGTARGKKSFRKELAAWRQLAHPNILPFLGVVCVENTYLGMVSPYMPRGSALKYVTDSPEADIHSILYDVAAGLSHLTAQKPPIAHGDLKGANVLIGLDDRACICDFGLSRFMKDFMSVDTTFGGTTRWMAPEQLRAETMTVSLPSDIFSWGMLALELMTKSIPWPEVQQDSAVVIKVAIHKQRPSRPVCQAEPCQVRVQCTCAIGDNALWALIQRCWLDDPKKRPRAHQLCEALTRNPRFKRSASGQETKIAPSRSEKARRTPGLFRKLARIFQ